MIKLTKIYFVRHCEAMGNVMRIFQGSTDLDISPIGEKQLEYLKKRFENIHIDKIYSSPLIRAQKTAEAIKGEKDIEIVLLKELAELHGGVVEGRKFAEAFATIEGLADAWDNHPQDFAPPEGETMRHAYERIWDAIQYIVKNNKNKTIACSSHGGLTRCLTCRLMKNDINELKNIPWSDNTAVMLFEIDDNMNISLKYFNDVSHLPKELVPDTRSRLSTSYTEETK